MLTLNVASSNKIYPIYIGMDLYQRLDEFIPQEHSAIFIIADETVANLYMNEVYQNIRHDKVFKYIVPSGEASKNVQIFYDLHTKALQAGLDRKSLIIALGGGMTGDLAGFVASTFMRGIDYIQIPTTILAHDSSVGGKVAINHEAGKNLIGNFHSPIMVIYNISALTSLPSQEIRSGFAELVKEAMIANRAFYEQLLQTDLYQINNDSLMNFLEKGMRIKANIVERDEREEGMRKFLNFGHTLGHALEAELGYGEMTHGEAVAMGLLFASKFSEKMYHCDLQLEQLRSWMKRNGYPLIKNNIDAGRLLNRMRADKKNVAGNIQMVLLQDIGKPITAEIDNEQLLANLKEFLGEMKV